MSIDWFNQGQEIPCGYYGMVKRYNIPFHLTEMYDIVLDPTSTVVTISLSYADDALGEEMLYKAKYLEKKSVRLREFIAKRNHMLQTHERFLKMNFVMFI